MRKNIKTISIALLLTGGIALTACLSVGSQDSEQVMQERPAVPSVTMTPTIPTHVTFCGEKVDLTRYNMYEGMDRELSSFTYFHSTTMLMIKRANRYFPVIEPILKANGIPYDFKYLAVIESHLDPRIVSPARAAGMWQFMEATAKQYQLIVTPTVDERYHVERATEAACRYLRDAYAKYGDWISVAASYNAGMGRISSEYARQNEASALNLWLVEETSRYVYRIFAIKQIFENPYKYGFVMHAKDLYRPISCEKVIVSNDIPDLVAFAKSHDITYADLKRFNSWLRDTKLVVNGKSFTISIPRKKDMYYNEPNQTVHDKRWVVR
ncbi:lytic transglycosylase domain-containing protein [Tannerella forsythia]|uniref:Lytic transglycosylase domain-containing protein n=1 Tax=Tannerella forsythia TaxID=28112 RepID=A0A3P1XTD4_TANFO|nr:lytic transglycosylase domain-containing protein [Tannerella forsythia]RRD62092.1 lytic transglycosylase domain-containing protein [Tannerella forsythia]